MPVMQDKSITVVSVCVLDLNARSSLAVYSGPFCTSFGAYSCDTCLLSVPMLQNMQIPVQGTRAQAGRALR